jgi:tRNA(fMet)-specific endonuclease VapC
MGMIVDTNALSAFFEGDPGIADIMSKADAVYVPVMVIGEFRYGLAGSRMRKKWEPVFSEFLSNCTILPVLETTAHLYAKIRYGLRKKGKPIPENDVWIAALAKEHGQPVLSRDQHFDQVTGVERIGF